MAFFTKFLEWIKSLFWKEEMELTLVGLQNSGKTTFVNVIAVRALSLCRCVGVCVWVREAACGVAACGVWHRRLGLRAGRVERSE
jgi:hypothetical protein